MELPLDLKRCEFISGKEELYQTIDLILKNQIGSFLQSPELGAWFSVHQSDEDILRVQVENTIKQIGSVKLHSVKVDRDMTNIEINIEYNSELLSFNIKEDER